MGGVSTLVRDLTARLATLEDGPAHHWLPAALQPLLGLEVALVHRVTVDGDLHQIQFFSSLGFGDGDVARIHAFMDGRHERVSAYNPAHPEPGDRNVAIRPKGLGEKYLRSPLVRELYPVVGCTPLDEIRVLLCEGPSLLAWAGGWRRKRFTNAEKSTLQGIVPRMRARLVAERRLADAAIDRAGLLAALEKLPGIALIADARGRLRDANTAGRAIHEVDPRALEDEIRRAIAGRSGPHRLSASAVPLAGARFFLLTGSAPGDMIQRILGRAVTRLALTTRQRDVLALLVEGAANRTIAEILGVTVRAVELHVTALLERASVENRTALAALVLNGWE